MEARAPISVEPPLAEEAARQQAKDFVFGCAHRGAAVALREDVLCGCGGLAGEARWEVVYRCRRFGDDCVIAAYDRTYPERLCQLCPEITWTSRE